MPDRSWCARELPTAAIPGVLQKNFETRTGCPGNLNDPERHECEAMWEMIAECCHGRKGARSAERCLRMSGSAPRRKQSTCLPKKRLSGVRDGDPRPSAPNPGHLTFLGSRTRYSLLRERRKSRVVKLTMLQYAWA